MTKNSLVAKKNSCVRDFFIMGNIIIRNHKNTPSKMVYKWLQNIIKGSPRGHWGILVGQKVILKIWEIKKRKFFMCLVNMGHVTWLAFLILCQFLFQNFSTPSYKAKGWNFLRISDFFLISNLIWGQNWTSFDDRR